MESIVTCLYIMISMQLCQVNTKKIKHLDNLIVYDNLDYIKLT